MTQTANPSIPEQGKFRGFLAGVWGFLQSLESTGFDYTLDRVERLERDVGRMKEELRQIRESAAINAHTASTPSREHSTDD